MAWDNGQYGFSVTGGMALGGLGIMGSAWDNGQYGFSVTGGKAWL